MPKRVRQILVFLLVILVFAVLARLSWDFVRDVIATPTYYLLWTGAQVMNAIPQQVYLGLLILVCSLIGLNTLSGMHTARFDKGSGERHSPPATRYSFWRRHAARLNYSRFSREQFAAETRNLLLALLAFQQHLDVAEVESMITTGVLEVPRAVKHLMMEKALQTAPLPAPNILNELRSRIPRLAAHPPADPELDAQIAEIIGFIEEISYAGNQPES